MKLTRSDIEALVASKPEGGQVNLHGEDLSGLDLSRLDLGDANLCRTTCRSTNFTDTNLRGANCSEADFSGALFNNADLDLANLNKSCLCNAMLYKARFRTANLAEACAEGSEGLDIQIRKASPEELSRIRERFSYKNGELVTFGRDLVRANIADFAYDRHYSAEDHAKFDAERAFRMKTDAAALEAQRSSANPEAEAAARKTAHVRTDLDRYRKLLAEEQKKPKSFERDRRIRILDARISILLAKEKAV